LLDADEFVSERLGRELRRAIMGEPRCYGLRRRSTFLGRAVRWGDWRKDVVWRLFPRGSARYDDALVHERLQCDLPRAVLPGDLYHETYVTRADVERKSDAYAELGARQLHARGACAHAAAPWLHAAWAWLRCFVLRLGFLDGRTGVAVAAMQARVAFRKYRRLRALCLQAHGSPRAENS
ncbi:MAG: glycosyltransferase family 2 protein, partial [Candidatus Bipolaricaulota bacterium]|nr:glycosyltransferase family 2 protein [Candidatus Bipolaricaulota bacterium]